MRVYGGALPASPAVVTTRRGTRSRPTSKDRVGRSPLALIEPGSTVLLDGGTTTLATVRALRPTLECTIITHSPTIAAALLDHAAEVIILGGRLFKHSAVASGAAAMEARTR